MGVPRLFPWLIKSFPTAVQHFQQGEHYQKMGYLYLDANGLLHAAAQEIYNYGDKKKQLDRYAGLSESVKRKKVYSMFFQNLIQITQIVLPTKVLYIAIDGPAPLAKQAQQRQRRFVAAKSRLVEEQKSDTQRFDSNSITPGTIFMHELTRYIQYAIRKEMNTYPGWKDIEVVFSPPTVPGEGEHKIMDYIRDLPDQELQNESHCLFGPDGDLIMLTLAAHIQNMWLFREDQFNPGFYHLLNMGIVRHKLADALGQEQGVRARTRTLNDVTDDFIVEGFFVGNDFLPKIQMFHLLEEGLGFMLRTYKNTSNQGRKNFLTVDSHLNLSGLKAFVEQISKSEQRYLLEQVTTREEKKLPPEPRYRNETLLAAVTETLVPGAKDPKYTLDFEKYREGYYRKLDFPGESDSSEFKDALKKLCRDYLRSFVWVFEYYVHGLPAWRLAYEHHYAPLMADFNEYIQSLDDREMGEISNFQLQTASLPFEQLLSVLPPPSAELLPSPYRRLMKDSRSPLVQAGYYPKDFPIDYEGKLQEHQGIAILPFVDYDVIHENYEKMTKCCVKNPEKYIRNSRGDPVSFQYDENYNARFTSDMGNISHLHVRKRVL